MITDTNFSVIDQSVALLLNARQLMAFKIGIAIQVYGLPIIVIVGCIGNLLSFIVMWQKHNRIISCCIYMAALALCDNVFLLIGGYYWLASYLQINFRELECVILAYLVVCFGFCNVMMILAITFDRFLATKYPLKAPVYCSTKRAKITIGVIVMVSFIYNIPHLHSTRKLSGGLCVSYATQDKFTRIYSILSLVITGLTPFLLLSAMNAAIISAIRKRSLLFKEFLQSGSVENPGASLQGKQQKKQEKQLTRMLLSISVVFLILMIPYYTRHIAYSVINNKSSPDAYALYVLLYHITNKMYFINSGINFFLYALSGSKFREDLVSLFHCK